jgi:hypothetical protein
LRPLEETATGVADARDHVVGNDVDNENGGEGDGEEENDDDDLDEIWQHDGRTFEEEIEAEIEVMLDFAQGLQHRLQFRDWKMLNTLQPEGGSFLRLARAGLEKDECVNVGKVNRRCSTAQGLPFKCPASQAPVSQSAFLKRRLNRLPNLATYGPSTHSGVCEVG